MISILCPTRNRPDGIKRAIESSYEMADYPDKVEWVLYIDNDSIESSTPTLGAYTYPPVKCVVGPRIILTDCWNKCLPAASGDIYGQGNDDIIFRTRGWDSMIEYMFSYTADKILLAHGDDGAMHNNGDFGAHAFVHKRWVEAVGYFIPPYFTSDYGDTWINDVANAVGCRRWLPFLFEHMHFCVGKAKIDQTTIDRLERHYGNEKRYEETLPERLQAIDKLRALVGTPYPPKVMSA